MNDASPGDDERRLSDQSQGRPGNKSAIAALTLGVLGIPFAISVFFIPIGVLFGLLAIIFGFLGRRGGRPRRGVATVGIVLGVLLVLWGLLVVALLANATCAFNDDKPDTDCDIY